MADIRDTLSYRLVRLGRATGAEYTARLGELGLRPLHVRLLTAIKTADRTPQNEHATDLGITGGFVVRLADDLERLGAVARERDTQDRRRQFLVITPAGESLLRKATLAATKLDEDLTRGLSRDALNRLAESLEIVRVSLLSRSDCDTRGAATDRGRAANDMTAPDHLNEHR